MKKLAMLAGALALGLGACGQNNGLNIGQGFGMDANVSGANVEVTPKAATVTAPASVQISITQPTIVFNASPQSVGFHLQKFTVEVLDNAGVRYAADQGLYQRSASAVIQPGYLCSSVDGKNPVPPLYQCAPQAKTAANVSTPIESLPLITEEVASQIATDCVVTTCPTLKMKVTFTGVDDAGRTQSVAVAGANISVTTK